MSESKTRFAFFEDKIVPIEDAKVSVMTQGLNYGTGVFAGMRAYWNNDEEQLFVYRPLDHFTRFLQSCSLMRIGLKYTPTELREILSELIRTEDFHENIYIRPLAYKAGEGIGVRLHDSRNGFTIFTQPLGREIEKRDGAHVCFSAWRRVDDNSIPARGKVAGAYANSALANSDAVLAGYDDAIMLNQDGHVSEMTTANFFIIRNGVVLTPPVNANVLEGIVRRSLIQLLQDEMGIEVVERNIDRTEVLIADEAFMCGTGAQIIPIVKIEHRAIGSGKIGTITDQLRNLFFEVVTGRVPKYRDWVSPVYIKEAVR